ncbi:MAG TPA: hypothetical protein VER17_04025 [Tepidisphaeraceae bacterium]|nr:hypothetical protein [Tepidisphaeraceae bacterium]
MSALFSVAIFFAVIVLAGALFFGWALVMIVRLMLGAAGMLFGGDAAGRRAMGAGAATGARAVSCQTRGSQAINPSDARFCRRCGRGLPAAHHVQVRRAAVW